MKTLEKKLAAIHADPHGANDFILADAKDADMALSIGAPGRSPESHPGEVKYRSLPEFRDIIRQIEALPPEEQREVMAFCRAKEATAQPEGASDTRMSFQEAKKHVFTEYRDVLEELAK